MRIQLTQSEIESALKSFVHNMGVNLSGKAIEINFTASRGSTGLLADMDITEVSASNGLSLVSTVAATASKPLEELSAGEVQGAASAKAEAEKAAAEAEAQAQIQADVAATLPEPQAEGEEAPVKAKVGASLFS